MGILTSDPDVLWGTPVFAGTRIPAKTLTDYLNAGDSLDSFLQDFPEVSENQARTFLDDSAEAMICASLRAA